MDELCSMCSKAVHGARRPEEEDPDYDPATRSVGMKNKEKILQPPFEKFRLSSLWQYIYKTFHLQVVCLNKHYLGFFLWF